MSDKNKAKWYVAHTYSGYENKVMDDILKTVENSYVMIKMIMNDDSWYVVRNCRGVTGFVGPGSKPVALTQEEVESMGLEHTVIKFDYNVGDNIRVKYGALEGFLGVITEINLDKKKVKATVSMFGRDTDVELEFNQIESIA